MFFVILILFFIVLISVANERIFHVQHDIALLLFSTLICLLAVGLSCIPCFADVQPQM